MASKTDTESPTILRRLSSFVLLFYVTYYLLSILLVGCFGVSWHELGKFPFRTSLDEFNPSYCSDDSSTNRAALAAWLAMVLTFLISLAWCFWVVRVTRRSWDYLVTASALHWVLCCCVGRSFPTGWVWWVTLLVAVLLTSAGAEPLIYWLRDVREIQLPQ